MLRYEQVNRTAASTGGLESRRGKWEGRSLLVTGFTYLPPLRLAPRYRYSNPFCRRALGMLSRHAIALCPMSTQVRGRKHTPPTHHIRYRSHHLSLIPNGDRCLINSAFFITSPVCRCNNYSHPRLRFNFPPASYTTVRSHRPVYVQKKQTKDQTSATQRTDCQDGRRRCCGAF